MNVFKKLTTALFIFLIAGLTISSEEMNNNSANQKDFDIE